MACLTPRLLSALSPRKAISSVAAIMASAISFGDAKSGFQAGIIHGSVNAEFRLPPGTLRKVAKGPRMR
ncbi:MAG: hypothetical protein M1815_003096 [Lichina confinis]|nr:MAG: hypothetical protein M1815_003096 [Lichina confinis]